MILGILLTLLVLFLAFVCVRALLVGRLPAPAKPLPAQTVDGEKAVRHLAQLVRIPTVSNVDEGLVDDAQFAALRDKLRVVHKALIHV